ncbi:CheY chemotaxis protein or a CheY-like REC (receiver) domain [Spirosoma fluviale]|uniref:CheY chemotaxis protein or a CheY-like REC (Receiver) domain n=2 Tax=Spirosoma fluviale TaxID=1597977 RepID=A0A286GBE0_9BACT|nr:CheY chemotaxis protein or a CheY-like REC (receiver) domain [Spirosoma fluviale]
MPDSQRTGQLKGKPLSGICILLVEDYPLNVLFARRLLEGWGGSVDVAGNGQDALNILDPAKHKLVLMDLQMPVMDGYESARRMRERGETIPIIALTADTNLAIDQHIQDYGLNGVLTKPLQSEPLLKIILALT